MNQQIDLTDVDASQFENQSVPDVPSYGEFADSILLAIVRAVMVPKHLIWGYRGGYPVVRSNSSTEEIMGDTAVEKPDDWAVLNKKAIASLVPLADLGDALFAYQKSGKLTQKKVDDNIESVGIDRRILPVARDASKHRKAAKLYAL